MTTKIKAWIQETLCNDEDGNGIVWVHFPDGKQISCHSANVENWLSSKGISPEETGKYGEDDG